MPWHVLYCCAADGEAPESYSEGMPSAIWWVLKQRSRQPNSRQEMSESLIKFLKEKAAAAKHAVHDQMSGEIMVAGKDGCIFQSVGSVYGMVTQLDADELAALRSELPRSLQKRAFQPLFEDWYPLYWGKDTNPGSRIRAHVQNHKGTGNAKLKNYLALQGKQICYAAIWVSGYAAFESHLHREFPPLLGYDRRGKVSDIVTIMD